MGQITAHPTSCVSDSGVGSVAWSNPLNVTVPGDVYATAALLITQQSHYLKTGGYRFAVPSDSVVEGVQVDIDRSANLLSGAEDAVVRLVKAGTVTGDNKAAGADWPASDAVATYGGPADLWGTTWTPADLNHPDFGAVVSATALLGVTAAVDSAPITVTYTGSNRPSLGNLRARAGDGMGVAL